VHSISLSADSEVEHVVDGSESSGCQLVEP